MVGDKMITVDLLQRFTGVQPETFGFDEEEDLTAFLEDIIDMASDMIREYTGRNFKEDIPETVKNCCLRLSGNIIAQGIARQDIELIRAGEYSSELLRSDVFTRDIKDDLKPFIASGVDGAGFPNLTIVSGDED